jgi:phage terminase Nu1 subunit (DNA packaging protein)
LKKNESEEKPMVKAKTKGEQIHEQVILTNELGKIIGKTPQWIRQLTRDNVLLQSGRGKYKLAESIQAYIEHVQGGKQEDNRPRFIDEKTQHEKIKRQKAELELAKMRGELHTSEDVEAVMRDMLTAFRQKILSIPTKLAPQLIEISDQNTVKVLLTNELHDALAELSDYNPVMFEEGAGVDVNAET